MTTLGRPVLARSFTANVDKSLSTRRWRQWLRRRRLVLGVYFGLTLIGLGTCMALLAVAVFIEVDRLPIAALAAGCVAIVVVAAGIWRDYRAISASLRNRRSS